MTAFLYLIGAALMVWLGFRMVRGNPAAFSRAALGKSFYTLGIVALLLMALIWICIKIT